MPRANDESKKITGDVISDYSSSDFSKLTSCTKSSQGELSIYEIDILSYAHGKGKKSKSSTREKGRKLKVKLDDSRLVIENEFLRERDKMYDNIGIPVNPLIKSHYPIVEELGTETDLMSVTLQLDSERKAAVNETNDNTTDKEKSGENENLSLDPRKSEKKFKSQLRKLILETFISKNYDKTEKLIKNLKKLENTSTHLHHHEHHHHHYYIDSSKSGKIKNFFKMSPAEENAGNESKEKNQNVSGSKNTLTLNTSEVYVVDESKGLTQPTVESSELETCDDLMVEQKNSRNSLPASSTGSVLNVQSELIATHSFSQADLSGSDKTNVARDGYGKTSIEPNLKNIPKLKPKKLLKPEYRELQESLKVLDKYLEPQLIAKTKAKVSYIKCQRASEEEDEEEGTEKESSGPAIDTSTREGTFPDGSITQSSVKTVDSDKNRRASHFYATRSSESTKLEAAVHHFWTEHLRQEIKDIKHRLRNMEDLYSKKVMKSLDFNMRSNNMKLKCTPDRKFAVFSKKTFIVKANRTYSEESSCFNC